ncbi:helix-turn-helix domain-containing protein [Nevskia sp.]|uniref:helix-turn-helix domain-containing protein n=1 Tax=Nevskia sp. TaxID=1929292 RepID=UPI0025CF16F1|nr:helix-turn-helix domain-containing protein [Nevskia sp.]
MDYPIRFTDQIRHQLRALRKARGLTQAELGDRLGVGQARIAEIERSPGTVSFDQMLQLLSLLDVSVVLKDSLPEQVTGEHSPQVIKKLSRIAVRNPLRGTATVGLPQEAGGESEGAARKKPNTPAATDLQVPRKLNASGTPTPVRHRVIQPKKGSW